MVEERSEDHGWHQRRSQRFTEMLRIHPLETLNVSAKSHLQLIHLKVHTSVQVRVVDGPTQSMEHS